MELERCPSCDAAVRPGAPWCTQCYADVRSPQIERSTASVGIPRVSASVHVDPLTAPLSLLTEPERPGVAVAPGTPPAVAPTATTSSETRDTETVPSWPCRCGVLVPLDLDVCPQCASPFLVEARQDDTISIPGIGRVERLEGGAKAAVIVGGAIGFMALFLVLAWIVGHVV